MPHKDRNAMALSELSWRCQRVIYPHPRLSSWQLLEPGLPVFSAWQPFFFFDPCFRRLRDKRHRGFNLSLRLRAYTANAKPAINRPNTTGRSSGFIQARHPNGSVCAKRITTVRECSHRTQGLPPWQERARRCDQPGPNNRVLRGLTKGTRSCK